MPREADADGVPACYECDDHHWWWQRCSGLTYRGDDDA